MEKSIYKILFLLSFVIGMSSCYFDVIVEEDLLENQKISFKDNVVPIFQSTCISCHNGTIALPNLYPNQAYQALIGGNYVIANDAENSPIMEKLNGDHPYQEAITNTELQTIELWINQGAAHN